MTVQLRLVAEDFTGPPEELPVPQRLLDKVRDLGIGLQLELRLRAPGALERLVDQLASVRDLDEMELAILEDQAKRDAARFRDELDRRRRDRDRCPDCEVRGGHHHLLGCSSAERARGSTT